MLHVFIGIINSTGTQIVVRSIIRWFDAVFFRNKVLRTVHLPYLDLSYDTLQLYLTVGYFTVERSYFLIVLCNYQYSTIIRSTPTLISSVFCFSV